MHGTLLQLRARERDAVGFRVRAAAARARGRTGPPWDPGRGELSLRARRVRVPGRRAEEGGHYRAAQEEGRGRPPLPGQGRQGLLHREGLCRLVRRQEDDDEGEGSLPGQAARFQEVRGQRGVRDGL